MNIPTMKTKWLSITALLLLFGSSCTPAIGQGAQEIVMQTAVISTNTPLPTLTPTFTQTPTITPTNTPTPIPIYPVPFGTPFPNPSEIISSENIDRLKQLSVIGQGPFTDVEWSLDGHFLAVSSTLGAYLYDAASMAPVLTVPSQSSPSIIFSDNSLFLQLNPPKIYISTT